MANLWGDDAAPSRTMICNAPDIPPQKSIFIAFWSLDKRNAAFTVHTSVFIPFSGNKRAWYHGHARCLWAQKYDATLSTAGLSETALRPLFLKAQQLLTYAYVPFRCYTFCNKAFDHSTTCDFAHFSKCAKNSQTTSKQRINWHIHFKINTYFHKT